MDNILNNLPNYIAAIFILFFTITLIINEIKSGIRNLKNEISKGNYKGNQKLFFILSYVLYGKDDN